MIPLVVILFYAPYSWANPAAAIVFIAAAVTDSLDGYLARRLGQTSALGAFLDPVADKLMVAVALVLLVSHDPPELHYIRFDPHTLITLTAAVIVGREITISALREWMAEMGARGKVAVSAVGKLKTIFQMTGLSMMLFRSDVWFIPAFELGVLSSVWDAAALAQSTDELRRLLQRSTWGDPRSDDPQDIHLALRLAWARRVATQVPEARAWADGGIALIIAGELFVSEHPRDLILAEHAGLGAAWGGAETIADLRAQLPPRASWALAGIETPDELWRAELGWWRVVGLEARAMTRSRLEGQGVVVGAIALLGLDAIRVRTALAVAAQDRSDVAREALDALC